MAKAIAHGIANGYRRGCRCGACREAASKHYAARKREALREADEAREAVLARDRGERLRKLQVELGGAYCAIDFGRDIGVRLVKLPPCTR